MINTSYGGGGIQPLQPSAAKLTAGVHGGNIEEVSQSLAQDSATVLSVLDRPVKNDMVADVGALKTQLWARLGEDQMHNALMTAGALMGGPHGVAIGALQHELKTTLADPKKLDELAGKIEKFGERGANETPPLRGDVYSSLNTQVTRGLVAEGVGGNNVPTATFISGALANAYQDQGGYNIAM